jgi:hypothetical protein
MKTAVEWLEEHIKNVNWIDKKLSERMDIIQQAKEMEKQQIMDACNTGIFHGGQLISTGRQYYNETFKSEENGSKAD